VTSIDIARPVVPQTARPKHPAVAGGQESRSPVLPAGAVADPPATLTSSHRSGVSSLEPSFARALPGPDAKRLRRQPAQGDVRREQVVVSPPRPQPPVPRFMGFADRGPQASEVAEDTTPLPVEEVNLALQGTPSMPRQQPRQPLPPQPSRFVPAEPVIHIDGLEREAVGPQAAFQQEAPLGLSPLDETTWVAGIPRCCDTCREFHRDASGKHGYCRSPYAFGGRTMVQSDQLACRSSIGVWWLPSDDTWLERADIAHHTRPTPYLDAILDELRPDSH
jgi:hypothetical protein